MNSKKKITKKVLFLLFIFLFDDLYRFSLNTMYVFLFKQRKKFIVRHNVFTKHSEKFIEVKIILPIPLLKEGIL